MDLCQQLAVIEFVRRDCVKTGDVVTHLSLPPSSEAEFGVDAASSSGCPSSRAQNNRSGMCWPIPGRNADLSACQVYSCASLTASPIAKPLAIVAAMAEASVQPD